MQAVKGHSGSGLSAMYVFCLDLSQLRTEMQFAVLAAGVFGFYLAYGYLQELIFSTWKQSDIHLGWFLTLFQFVLYTLLSVMQRSLSPLERAKLASGFLTHVAPLPEYAVIGFFSVATIGLSNASCEFLNYPTQVVFKSCKLIPVMVMGVVILNKSYVPAEYMAAVLFCVGLAVFTLADKLVSPEYNTTGIALIVVALVADAFIGNLQERMFLQHRPSAMESLLFVKGIGSAYLLVIVVASGQLGPGLTYCLDNTNMLMWMVAFSASGWLGENFIMLLVKRFGAVVTVTTTSLRKAVTIAFSFLMFPKPYTHAYLVGTLLILAAVFLSSLHNNPAVVANILGCLFGQRATLGEDGDVAEVEGEPVAIPLLAVSHSSKGPSPNDEDSA